MTQHQRDNAMKLIDDADNILDEIGREIVDAAPLALVAVGQAQALTTLDLADSLRKVGQTLAAGFAVSLTEPERKLYNEALNVLSGLNKDES